MLTVKKNDSKKRLEDTTIPYLTFAFVWSEILSVAGECRGILKGDGTLNYAEKNDIKTGQMQFSTGHCRNVRELGKSKVVFCLFEKLRYSNKRCRIKSESLNHEWKMAKW